MLINDDMSHAWATQEERPPLQAARAIVLD